jgi:hypothetical protein
MPSSIDPASYALFERVLLEAIPPNVYMAEFSRKRRKKSVSYTKRVPEADKATLPWGEVGKIFSASWFSCEGSYFDSSENPGIWRLSINCYNEWSGLSVDVYAGLYDEFRLRYDAIGLQGSMKEPGTRHPVWAKNEDELVGQVIADIAAFYEAYANSPNASRFFSRTIP